MIFLPPTLSLLCCHSTYYGYFDLVQAPKLEEHSTEFDMLVVEVETKEKNIRIISGYGPQ